MKQRLFPFEAIGKELFVEMAYESMRKGMLRLLSRKRLIRLVSAFLAVWIMTASLPYGGSHDAYGQVSVPLNGNGGHAVPPLLITEIVPDTTNVNGSDGYEFFELYNATDRPINLGDYTIVYRYPSGPQNDVPWVPINRSIDIAPGGTLVVWLSHPANAHLTATDFNRTFGTSLVDNISIVKAASNGMVNERMRTIALMTNTVHPIVEAAYNDGFHDVASNKGIFYKYPSDGSGKMVKIGSKTDQATPGTVAPEQVPSSFIHVNDRAAPLILNATETQRVSPTGQLDIAVEAEDDVLVRTMTLYYRSSVQPDFKAVNLARSSTDSLFRHTIEFVEFIGADSLEYYFTASDGVHQTVSDVYTVLVAGSDTNPRLNVRDGDIVAGTVTVRGTSTAAAAGGLSLYVDGSAASSVYRSLEREAYFVFDAEGIDASFQNAVTMGTDIIQLMNEAIPGYTTVAVPIEADQLSEGSNTITIWAGSTRNTFETNPNANLDDFNIKNVRLLLADGSVVRDRRYIDPQLVFDMGDGGRYLPFVDFTFQLVPDRMNSVSYRWDTVSASDGWHSIKAVTGDGLEASALVLVDNTKPAVWTNVAEGTTLKGNFVMEASVTDGVSGIQYVNAAVDGQPIGYPIRMNSTELNPGPHVLSVSAADKAGNAIETVIRFSKVEETPIRPQLVSPANGAADLGSAVTLNVYVADPTNDPLDVSFYRAYSYTAANSVSMQVYKNVSETEPPHGNKPEGERSVTEEELEALQASDDTYVTVDATSGFPYLRFNVRLDGEIGPDDVVELWWEGHSLPSRKVTLYAWNNDKEKWTPLDSFIARSEEDFVLKGNVSAAQYVRDNEVHVIVQDLIPTPEQYDYTFVWLSDTQFYTELYPAPFESQVNWIRDNADAMNIRYVIHTGDIVNEVNQEFQWQRADQNMGVLDQAGIPYGVLAGNHDVDSSGMIDYTNFYRYFGQHRFQDKPYFGEAYSNNRGHYDLISAGGNDYIFVYMGWEIRDEDMAWMNKVLAEHPERKAFLCFHDYLNPQGVRSATGEQLFRRVVVPNPNVVFVLSGHHTGSVLLTDGLDDNGDGTADRNVYQILSDYQGTAEGGSGYMKLLHFDPGGGNVYFNTYSPYKNDYNYYEPEQYPGKDEFMVSLDMEPKLKRVATDYLRVRLYTDDLIGTASDVPSGQEAQTVWSGLANGLTYSWYARAEDDYGGWIDSDIWSFTTDGAIPTPDNVRVTSLTATTAELAWAPVTTDGAAGTIRYDIYENNRLHASVTDAVYYVVAGLAPDTEYEFTIVANSGTGHSSEASAPVRVRTLLDLSVIRKLVDRYSALNELRKPLLNQLDNKLKQAEHHFEKGSDAQANKFLKDFLEHLEAGRHDEHISREAKTMLEQKTNDLLMQRASN